MLARVAPLAIAAFGFLFPALSSVKAVVRRDRRECKIWCTYWLVLQLNRVILSSLHPVFHLIAVLWLSLPSYQGAAVVYERIVTPLVDRHECLLDERIDEAHAFSRRFIARRVGRICWLLLAESGDLTGSLLGSALGLAGSSGDANNPRHSIRSSLIEMEDAGEVRPSLTPTSEFLDDFTSMLSQGLYVFARIHEFGGEGFKLGVLACDEDLKQFTISLQDGASMRGRCTAVPFAGVQISPQLTNEIVLENETVRVCLRLSDHSDRNILLSGILGVLSMQNT
ncbi:hypothetical protein THAOC_10575 [Thalassiosira oceanica]|uniref:Uncharacterized protein n=1 Tax=Thalassiosira oceanica TaxID=159749 RepID=K0STG7_THAOC|nr:hypothetical protein THAOC_10575 [Thalassiosira oceanica]|mmetsp:Transcript_31012/g.70072  ORF Transcript_31012/g.70072 Transcript_31012/m.70072 type:complete len:282 (+) Transcript_31012:270-1115(+)|eukprot:EJK68264.1 hypothetical protein THAOC_10575 [Thalassiosira oceanica]